MTSLERRVLRLYEKALAQEQKNIDRCSELAQFAGNDLGLQIAITRHRSNIKMYEKLITTLKRRES